MKRTLAFALAAPLLVATIAPVSAQVARSHGALLTVADDDMVTQAQWRRRGVPLGVGIGAGLLLGGVIAASRPYDYGPYPYGYGYGPPVAYGPPVVYGPPAVYGPPLVPGPAVAGDAVAYCMQRFRSYDPASGSYLGFDGVRHPCP